jgi:hypothetical protein
MEDHIEYGSGIKPPGFYPGYDTYELSDLGEVA